MNEALFQRIFPLEYIMRHVNNGEREDGRKERQWREVTIQRSNLMSYSESLSDTESEVFCAIGGTIVQAKVSVSRIQRGVFGSARMASNPIVINLTGEENLKSLEFRQQYTVFKYIRNQVLKIMGQEFRELKPEADSFRVLNFSIRVIMDEGNHLGAVLLSALSAFYLWVTTQQFIFEDGQHGQDWGKSIPFPVVFWEAPASSAEKEGQLFVDPTYKEEQVGGSIWVFLISETGQSVFRNGGSTLPSGLTLMTDDGKGAKWRSWILQGENSAKNLML